MRLHATLVRLTRRSHGATVFVRAIKRGRRDKDLDRGGVLVEPNRPNTLTGGAAAALEYDE